MLGVSPSARELRLPLPLHVIAEVVLVAIGGLPHCTGLEPAP